MGCLALRQMELDQQHLQFLFTVIAITAITSLAAICYLLRRDNQRLLTKFNPQPEVERNELKNLSVPSQAAAAQKPDALVPSEPEAKPGKGTDIREFVTHRAHTWVAPSASQWNRRLDSNRTVSSSANNLSGWAIQ
jgi:hypothetical protein